MKVYIKPDTEVIYVTTESMIATSGGETTSSPDSYSNSVGDGHMMSKQMGFFYDSDDNGRL